MGLYVENPNPEPEGVDGRYERTVDNMGGDYVSDGEGGLEYVEDGRFDRTFDQRGGHFTYDEHGNITGEVENSRNAREYVDRDTKQSEFGHDASEFFPDSDSDEDDEDE